MHDAGRDVPAIRNRPDISGLGWLWDAFWELHTCRSLGMTAGPIPWTAVSTYAAAEELCVGEAHFLHSVIRHMDNVWLHFQDDKMKASAGANKKKGGSRGGSR